MQFVLKKLQKQICMLTAAALLIGGLLGGQAGTAYAAESGDSASSEGFSMTLMHLNDTHANLKDVAKRVTAVNQVREESVNSILLDAGDVMSGTLYFNTYLGLADLAFMNEIGYDAMTFGNHEFDLGPSVLADFVKDAKFPFVSSNVDFSKEPELSGFLSEQAIAADAENGKIYEAILLEVGGEKVGVFGLTTPDTKFLASPGEHIVFENYIASAKETVEALQNQGINKIIALTHIGYDFDLELANEVTGIDVIVGGHSHTKVDKPVEVYHGDVPTLVVQANEYNKYLGKVDLQFNNEGVLTKWDGELLDIASYEADPAATDMLKPYQEGVEEIEAEVIGTTLSTLDGERGNVRSKETSMGNMMTDGMASKLNNLIAGNPELQQYEVQGVVAIQNGGGIRASIPYSAKGKADGNITLGELLTTMPFGNNMTALRMTGQEIIDALENGVSGVETGQGRFSQVSGMRYYFDSSKQAEVLDETGLKMVMKGERIVKVEIEQEDGTFTPIDPEAEYFVATNSFIADGGDFYRSMKQAKDAGRHHELNIVDYEVFWDYIKELDGKIDVSIEGRITDLNQFSDVAAHLAEASIKAGIMNGIINGFQDGTFRPDDHTTRAQFMTMLGRMLGLSGAESSLEALDANEVPAWALSYVEGLVEANVIEAGKDQALRPQAILTKAEMTEMVERAFGIDVEAAAQAGLIDGFSSGSLSSQSEATRAEVISLLLAAKEYQASK